MTDPERLNDICFWLIEKCRETNSDVMKVKQQQVIHEGELWGDWEITVRKV